MNNLLLRFNPELSWKSWSAITIFVFGLVGLASGVSVSERPGVSEVDLLTKAYYTLGLFVLGGMDLGTPTTGPLYGRVLLWFSYFGAPIWTASAVIQTFVSALRPRAWHIRRNIKNKIVIFGGGELTFGFLNRITSSETPRRVLVIVDESRQPRLDELRSYDGVSVLLTSGDQRYRLRRYPLYKAHKLLLLNERDEVNFEAASLLLDHDPGMGQKIVFHASNLRFLRVMKNTTVVRQCTSFNINELAATQLTRDQLIRRFNATAHRDTVVIAGFGDFGQSILEQLEKHAEGAFSRVAIIDRYAQQRAMIADEQVPAERNYGRHTYQGDVDDPEIWQRLFGEVVIADEEPVFILTTGSDQTNLRCAIWLRQQFREALIITRTLAPSTFAKKVSREHDIVSVNTMELVQSSIPHAWYR